MTDNKEFIGAVGNTIEGLVFVLSGRLNPNECVWESRKDIEHHLSVHGARIAKSVGRSVNYVVSLDEEMNAAKMQAAELGIPVISIERFNYLVGKIFPDEQFISIPTWMKEIPASAFASCESLTEITIPDSVEEIGAEAFAGCRLLKKVILPGKLKELGAYAFSQCTRLSEITISEMTHVGRNAFDHCEALADKNGLIIVGGRLDSCLHRIEGPVEIPEGVKSIGRDAFYHLKVLTVRPTHFEHNGITSISFPKSLKRIEDEAFRTCTDLREVVLPDGLQYLGHKVFLDSYNLKKVWIPASVTKIEEDAFQINPSIAAPFPKVTLYAPSGSYAQEYARENNLKFIESDLESFALK